MCDTNEKNETKFPARNVTLGTKSIIEAMIFLSHTNVKTTQKYLNIENDIKGVADEL